VPCDGSCLLHDGVAKLVPLWTCQMEVDASIADACASEAATLLPSPTKGERPTPQGPSFSLSVRKSARPGRGALRRSAR